MLREVDVSYILRHGIILGESESLIRLPAVGDDGLNVSILLSLSTWTVSIFFEKLYQFYPVLYPGFFENAADVFFYRHHGDG